jgi:DNA-binding MarR family transcriptional regulator
MATLKPPSVDDFARAAELREALRRFQRTTDDIAGAADLTTRTYQLLLMIKTGRTGQGRASLRELEERLQLGKSTITELVLRTERRGLVRRDLDRHRPGAISVRLTPAGDRRLTQVTAELGDERRRLIDILSELR